MITLQEMVVFNSLYGVDFRPNGHFQPSGFLFIRPSSQFFGLSVFYLFSLLDSAQWISSREYDKVHLDTGFDSS